MFKVKILAAVFGFLALFLSNSPTALAEELNSHTRVKKNSSGDTIGLEVAVASLKRPRGALTVDLISAIHIADKKYFEDLNRRFRSYDAVLYELVVTDATSDPSKINSGKALQDPIAEFADLSAVELGKAMKASGSTFFSLFVSLMKANSGSELKEMSEELNIKVLLAMISPNRALVLKRLMAEFLGELGGSFDAFSGEVGELLIVKRNLKALEVLKATEKKFPNGNWLPYRQKGLVACLGFK